jgi:hypothetical protein
MSESNTESTVFSKEFEQLETSMVDPYIEKVLSLVRQYNEIIHYTAPTQDEKNEIVAELDTEWGSALRMPMKATGRIATKAEEGNIEKSFYEDLDVVSNGFCMIEEPIYVDGDLISTKYVIKHHLLVAQELIGVTGGEEGALVGATAEVDDVILELPTASYERSVAWLSENYPDFIQEDDENMLNSDGTEADALLALRNIIIPKELCEDTEFARNCLVVYLNMNIQLDQHVPYSVSLDGKVHSYNEDGTISVGTVESDSTLAMLKSITVGRYNPEAGNDYEIFVSTMVLSQERSAVNMQLNIPLASIQTAMSIRSAYYDS